MLNYKVIINLLSKKKKKVKINMYIKILFVLQNVCECVYIGLGIAI